MSGTTNIKSRLNVSCFYVFWCYLGVCFHSITDLRKAKIYLKVQFHPDCRNLPGTTKKLIFFLAFQKLKSRLLQKVCSSGPSYVA